ncbi:MAG: hypothetical protein LW875_04320 [Proteobacteria bacterium]|jgi:hypothetical protein|nr:hypothetical protein [Pseudomonadota bacterium]
MKNLIMALFLSLSFSAFAQESETPAHSNPGIGQEMKELQQDVRKERNKAAHQHRKSKKTQ